jgi:hypothetical protein
MSESLLLFAKNFLQEKSNEEAFCDEFIERWKRECKSGVAKTEDPALNEALSTIFCTADCYSPDPNPDFYEIDEIGLRREIEDILKKFGFL